MQWMERTRLILGEVGIRRLARARVAVFGLGAVGSYAVESLARAGVGAFLLADFDEIHESNLNRQLYALRSTLERSKVEVARDRILDINSAAIVDARQVFVHSDTLDCLLAPPLDLVIDAVDSLNPKTEIIARSAERNIAVFSAMGAATRTDASRIKFAPLFEASGCPLNRHIKKRLRRRGVAGDLWCVYSDEEKRSGAVVPAGRSAGLDMEDGYERGRRRDILGSLPTITGLFGLRLGHEAILRLARGPETEMATPPNPPAP